MHAPEEFPEGVFAGQPKCGLPYRLALPRRKPCGHLAITVAGCRHEQGKICRNHLDRRSTLPETYVRCRTTLFSLSKNEFDLAGFRDRVDRGAIAKRTVGREHRTRLTHGERLARTVFVRYQCQSLANWLEGLMDGQVPELKANFRLHSFPFVCLPASLANGASIVMDNQCGDRGLSTNLAPLDFELI